MFVGHYGVSFMLGIQSYVFFGIRLQLDLGDRLRSTSNESRHRLQSA